MELITVFTQTLVAIAVGYIAWQQYNLAVKQAFINKQRVKNELFDRRMSFVEETKEYIRSWDHGVLSSFSSHIARAELLFPESPIAQLKIMMEVGTKFCERLGRNDLHETETLEERNKRIHDDLIDNLNRHYAMFLSGVKEHLKIEEYNA